ncbi:Hypothetical predicted protein [Paramuricea clavata]|uniref:Uncharacterized protein n=1 Tax=Paramuricea clavata TaxID=317549 RepID=A0A6S7J643_PARCT|nr:Hypothetical predicted protein [Paramuricea clavata]
MKESGEADISFKTPKFFSETRFANHARKLYVSFREDFPAIIRTLEEVQLENMEGNSDDRKKATHASDLSDKILNKRFTVILSGLCDIYEVFGHGVNILQTVDMLPHDKFDRFHSVVIEEIKTLGSYRGIPMAQSYGEEINTRMGERRAARNARDEQQGIVIVKAQQDLQKLVQRMYECLHNRVHDEGDKSMLKTLRPIIHGWEKEELQEMPEMSNKVYDEGDKSMLKNLRPIIDLRSLALKVKQKGAAHVLALDGELFTKVSKQLATNIVDVPDSEIQDEDSTVGNIKDDGGEIPGRAVERDGRSAESCCVTVAVTDKTNVVTRSSGSGDGITVGAGVGMTGAAEVGCPRTQTGPLASPQAACERKPRRGAAA